MFPLTDGPSGRVVAELLGRLQFPVAAPARIGRACCSVSPPPGSKPGGNQGPPDLLGASAPTPPFTRTMTRFMSPSSSPPREVRELLGRALYFCSVSGTGRAKHVGVVGNEDSELTSHTSRSSARALRAQPRPHLSPDSVSCADRLDSARELRSGVVCRHVRVRRESPTKCAGRTGTLARTHAGVSCRSVSRLAEVSLVRPRAGAAPFSGEGDANSCATWADPP